MPTAASLESVMRQQNHGELPSSLEGFVALFCQVFGDHEAFGLANPWFHGRPLAEGDDALRLRVRFKWRASGPPISINGIYVRDQVPPTREATLAVSARTAWSCNAFIRFACEGIGGSIVSGDIVNGNRQATTLVPAAVPHEQAAAVPVSRFIQAVPTLTGASAHVLSPDSTFSDLAPHSLSMHSITHNIRSTALLSRL